MEISEVIRKMTTVLRKNPSENLQNLYTNEGNYQNDLGNDHRSTENHLANFLLYE